MDDGAKKRLAQSRAKRMAKQAARREQHGDGAVVSAEQSAADRKQRLASLVEVLARLASDRAVRMTMAMTAAASKHRAARHQRAIHDKPCLGFITLLQFLGQEEGDSTDTPTSTSASTYGSSTAAQHLA